MQSWQNDPIIGQPAAQPAPPRPAQQPTVIGGRRVIGDVPPSEIRAQQDQVMQERRFTLEQQRLQAQLDKQAQDAATKAPSGYRYTADGNLEPIPGGPATSSREGGAIPVSAANAIRPGAGALGALNRAIDTFNEDYFGNVLGGLENTAQAYTPEAFGEVGTPGQADWWADFRRTDNLERNELFGATLTPGEKQAYAATTITPGMNAKTARANLERRRDIVLGVLEREKEFYLANGYKPEAVDALFAILRPSAAQQPAATPPGFEQDDQAAPVVNGTDPQLPDLRAGAGLDNGGDGGFALGSGEARREDNPTLAGVRTEYARRLAEGQTAQELITWARSAGIDPSAFRSIQEQVRFRDANPGVPVEQYDTTQLDDRFVPNSGFDQAINAAAQNPAGAFAIGVGDAMTGFSLDNIIGAVGGNAERARLAMDEVGRQNPVSNTLGTVAGGVGVALGGEAALGLGAGARLGAGSRALLADTAYGAAAGAGATDDGSSRAIGALKGAGAAAAGSFAGQRAGNALQGVARGVNNPSMNALRQAGVTDMTIGQAVGNSGRVGAAIKGVEDRMSGIPVIGDMVNARRTEGLRQFNQAAFNKALEPIGGNVGGKVGQEAIEDAQNQVSQAFTTALAGKGALPDAAFSRDLSAAVAGISSIKRLGDEVKDEIGEIMRPYANDPMLSGEALDDISRNLRTLKANYIAARDPLATRVGKQIDRVERAVFDLFDRQASGTIEEYRKARAAYRRLSTLEDAVLKAQNQQDNVFTPAQLGQADKSNTKRFGGKRAAARGDMPFNELQQAGQDVLPNRVPDSGTLGRSLIPLAAIGAGGASDASGTTNGAGLTIGLILSGAYSRTGQRALTKPLRGMKQGAARNMLESNNTRRALSATGGAGSAALITNQR